MANVKFEDFRPEVKAALNQTTIAWLHEWGSEVQAQAARNCKMDDNGRLRGSYQNIVDEQKGVATIGSPLESVYWEEFGTGAYADTSKNGGKRGRAGWWVYVEDYNGQSQSTVYNSRDEAEAVASSMRAEGFKAHATNGRRPAYTLEKSFETVRPKAVSDLQDKLKERMEK